MAFREGFLEEATSELSFRPNEGFSWEEKAS